MILNTIILLLHSDHFPYHNLTHEVEAGKGLTSVCQRRTYCQSPSRHWAGGSAGPILVLRGGRTGETEQGWTTWTKLECLSLNTAGGNKVLNEDAGVR